MMAYEPPTFFGVIYAKRLFDEIDESPTAYEVFCRGTAPELDLRNCEHAQAMLTWLNDWGCRIDTKLFPTLKSKLSDWFIDWTKSLHSALELLNLMEPDLDYFRAAYGELVNFPDFGPTTASKILFGLCPRAAVPWDASIQKAFKLIGPAPQHYRTMLVRCQNEAQSLVCDASNRGVSALYNCEGRLNTLPWLLDKYHWVTITRRHRIPTPIELHDWLRWASREPTGSSP